MKLKNKYIFVNINVLAVQSVNVKCFWNSKLHLYLKLNYFFWKMIKFNLGFQLLFSLCQLYHEHWILFWNLQFFLTSIFVKCCKSYWSWNTESTSGSFNKEDQKIEPFRPRAAEIFSSFLIFPKPTQCTVAMSSRPGERFYLQMPIHMIGSSFGSWELPI